MAVILDYKGVDICQEEITVLKDVNFSVEQNQFVFLCGKVGSGKSSLLKTMYAEIPIKVGEARIFDYDLLHLKRKDIPYLRRKIGIVFFGFRGRNGILMRHFDWFFKWFLKLYLCKRSILI